MGPITLFDKSFLQSLSLDEAVWFDHFFYPNICPLFYVETLADLTKNTNAKGHTAEDQVRAIADTTPELSGGPCVHHQELSIANLMGFRLPMTGQIPVAGARLVEKVPGKRGAIYDPSPETMAFMRWQRQEFFEVERTFAAKWRKMLTELDLARVAHQMRTLGINPQSCKSVERAHEIAIELVNSRTKPYDQMGLLFTFLSIPPQYERPILERWRNDGCRNLSAYAPYASHVLAVEVFFQICIAAHLISTERASNRIDIAYLFYLPFCMAFTSGDKLHRKCAPLFLREDQDFLWAPGLKAELARLDEHFSQLPEELLAEGVMKIGRSPVGGDNDLLVRLWNKHFPGWKARVNGDPEVVPENNKPLMSEFAKWRDAPTVDACHALGELDELETISIERIVRHRKGKWWLLPRSLHAPETGDLAPKD